MSTYTFTNKRALVTGAGKGIGRAIAISLARSDADVVALSRSQQDLDSLIAVESCGSITPLCVDLGDWEATRQAVSKAGSFDLLVNNAAISIGLTSCLDALPDDFDKMMSVNVKAVMNVTQIVAKDMIARGKGGSIVMVSSIASSRALNEHLLYCSTKGALDQMMRVFALELGKHQIRVNSVNPTIVMTPMGKRVWDNPSKGGPMLAKIPQGKFAEEEHVVQAVLFLLSDKSDMIHGATLPVDGGMLTSM